MHAHLHAVSRFLVISYFLLFFCDVIKHQSRYHMDLLKMTVCYLYTSLKPVNTTFMTRKQRSWLNPFQPSVVFNKETSHLIRSSKQKIGFYYNKRNTRLNWVKDVL